MTDHQKQQRVIGEVLIPEARKQQSTIPPIAESLPFALELFYTAFAMKPAHWAAGCVVARRYAARMGLAPHDVEAFAVQRIAEAVAEHG